MLPQQGSTTLARRGQITKDRQRELFEGRVGLEDNAFEAGYDTSLGGFFLAGFVEPAEVVAGLEDMIGHFLSKSDRRINNLFDFREVED